MGKSVLDRDSIKCIAMFTMLLNHIAQMLLTPEFVFYDVFVGVGYFTAITMCYFLVEGFEYTRSKKKYGQRLLLFIVMMLPTYLAEASFGPALLHTVLDSLSLVASGVVILFLYNGRKSKVAPGFF